MRQFIHKLTWKFKFALANASVYLILTVVLWDVWRDGATFFLGGTVGALASGLWYLFFDDTMNRVQYIPIGGDKYLYYITRNNVGKGTPWAFKSFMSMTSTPWLKGKGHTFRLPRGLSFQVGTARKMLVTVGEDGLSKALGARPLNLSIDSIRTFKPSRLVKK